MRTATRIVRTSTRIVVVVGLAIGIAAASAAAAPAAKRFTVRSTLRGRTVLPHRIHWYAYPSLPSSKIVAVDFLIDGRLRWVEHNAPYDYGFNGNYLVTSWLKPGRHRFTVVAHANDGRRARRSVTANVLPAAPPPAPLDGTWTRTMTPAQTQGQPAGTWILKINKIGWWIKVPDGGPGANLIDVAYLQEGLLESRGGIWTKPNPPNNPTQGNGWCDEPFQPVQYQWSVSETTLTLTLAGPARCDGESVIWAGTWTHATS
jgi:hypothetical protein